MVRICCLAVILLPLTAVAQSQQENGTPQYQISPAPDIWYNSVDGVRVGVRIMGEVPGTFGTGPHRLNAGVWLGTYFPVNPVSYYLEFTEPIPSLSDFGSEASVSLETSYRTGFQRHGLRFNKRWQPGFNEMNYKELSVGFRGEHRFNEEYLFYRQVWQENWLFIGSVDLNLTDDNSLGRHLISFTAGANIAGKNDPFFRSTVILQQWTELNENFALLGRLYSGFATEATAPEYLFSHSMLSPRSWMESGLTRARGTIPPAWMRSGNIQVTGGPNLRGYLFQDIQALNNGNVPLYTSLSSVNFELDYPNPLNKAIDRMPVVGELVNLRSYLFFDAGTSLGLTKVEEQRILSDAGLGFLFSINIPDYLGKSRGLAIRYDLPLWLSHPGTEKSFKFRNVVGIGAVISL